MDNGKGSKFSDIPDWEGSEIMAIKYDKLLNLLEKKGYTSYRIRKDTRASNSNSHKERDRRS